MTSRAGPRKKRHIAASGRAAPRLAAVRALFPPGGVAATAPNSYHFATHPQGYSQPLAGAVPARMNQAADHNQLCLGHGQYLNAEKFFIKKLTPMPLHVSLCGPVRRAQHLVLSQGGRQGQTQAIAGGHIRRATRRRALQPLSAEGRLVPCQPALTGTKNRTCKRGGLGEETKLDMGQRDED